MTDPIPGPWKISDDDNHTIVIVSPWSEKVKPGEAEAFGDYRGAHICTIDYNSGVPSKEQAMANAEFIINAESEIAELKALLTPTDDEREEMECAGNGHEDDDLVTWLRESRQATRARADRADKALKMIAESYAAFRRSLNESLNSGNGVYRP
jgi:hypothetical protein